MKTKPIIALAATAIILVACTSKQENENKEVTSSTEESITVTVHQFKTVDTSVSKHIQSVIDNYLSLKDNLVKTDAVSTANSAERIKKTLMDFDKSILTGEQKQVYEKTTGSIQTELDDMIKSVDIAGQREVFSKLTGNIYQLAKTFGYGKTIYYDYCPMALNDKGAMWLSAEKEILNPYFGDEMLSCGSLKEEIK